MRKSYPQSAHRARAKPWARMLAEMKDKSTREPETQPQRVIEAWVHSQGRCQASTTKGARCGNASSVIDQILLSDALGMSHIHGHRVFRELDRMGLIERSYEGVQILDMEKLADFAEFDSSYLETADFENLSI